jgi:hypothetical protein
VVHKGSITINVIYNLCLAWKKLYFILWTFSSKSIILQVMEMKHRSQLYDACMKCYNCVILYNLRTFFLICQFFIHFFVGSFNYSSVTPSPLSFLHVSSISADFSCPQPVSDYATCNAFSERHSLQAL